jgi:hypothetical protein
LTLAEANRMLSLVLPVQESLAMRAKTLAAAALLWLAAPAAQAAPPTVEEAKALLTTVVALNNKYPFGAGPQKFVAVHSTPLMHAYFTDAYCKSWDRAMTKNGQEPVFDGDGLDGSQEVKRLALGDVSVDGDTVKATLTRYSAQGEAPAKETLMLKLAREGGKLKIDDIGDDAGDGTGLKWRRAYLDGV